MSVTNILKRLFQSDGVGDKLNPELFKADAAWAASPSNKFINLTQSSFPYPAPADGIVRAVAKSTKSGDIFGLTTDVITVNSSLSTAAGNQFDVIIPVSKNEEVQLDLRTYEFIVAYFIYLNGNAPE